MLNDICLDQILGRIPSLTIGVLGDLFLDRYLDIDSSLTEPSIETGLDAYQVIRARSYPGAAGTVINNLVALGVKKIHVFSALGDDGEGYELLRALSKYERVETCWIQQLHGCPFRTPTYTKPMLHEAGLLPRELNRLDIKNRTPPPTPLHDVLARPVSEMWPQLDALVVADQVSEADCGVITAGMRNLLAELGRASPDKVILADSRERIGLFRSVWLKPNQGECVRAVESTANLDKCVTLLARRAERPVFCTRADQGILLADPRQARSQPVAVSAYPVPGPIDPVGAGDSTSAALACALATGITLAEAAAFGNLVASITIQQLGTTGTATPEQIRQRWHDLKSPG